MADLSLLKVDLNTPQPDGRRGESPRAAFLKYNELVDEVSSGASSTATAQSAADAAQTAAANAQSTADGALQKSDNLGALTDKAAARGNLDLGTAAVADVVGTMSGGAIIESGSNSNGWYVKFADGTASCFVHRTTPSLEWNTQTVPSYSQYIVWALPLELLRVTCILGQSQDGQVSGRGSVIPYAEASGTGLGFYAACLFHRSAGPAAFRFRVDGTWK